MMCHYSESLSWDQTGTLSLSEEIDVLAQDRIAVQVKIDSPIDVSQLAWSESNPLKLFYVAAEGLDTTTDEDGNPLIQLDLFYSYDLYPQSDLSVPLQTWTPSVTDTYTVTPQLVTTNSYTDSTTVIMTVKGNGEQVAKHTISITDGAVENGLFTIDATPDDEFFFEFSSRNAQLLAQLSQISAEVIDSNAMTETIPTEYHSASEATMLAPPYRGWNVFGYNGNRERADNPIEITPEDLSGESLKDATEALQAAQENGTLEEDYDPNALQLKVIPFYPEPVHKRWKANDENAWAQADKMSSSRDGMDYIEVPRADTFAGARAVSRLSRGDQFGVSLGLGFLSGARSDSDSEGLLDYIDMNGDRFPDIVGGCGVQYTNMLGGLESGCQSVLAGAVRASDGESTNFGISGSFPMTKVGASGRQGTTGNQMVSLGVSGNVSQGESDSKYDLMDVNGDGLPDRVSQNGGQLLVALNLGYGFAPTEPWGNATINHGESDGVTLGGSLGFNGGIYDFGGGLSLTRGSSESDRLMLDINGDGLLDRVSTGGSGILVGLNTGNGFTNDINWPSQGLNRGTSTSLGGGVYFTIGIGPLCLVACYIIINPGADYSKSMNRQETTISDINGGACWRATGEGTD